MSAKHEVSIEYESSDGATRRMLVTSDEAVTAAERIRAEGGRVLGWYLMTCEEVPNGKA